MFIRSIHIYNRNESANIISILNKSKYSAKNLTLFRTVCAHRKTGFLRCVRTQILTYINKTTFFWHFSLILLVTL